jgi:hypothetical protein
MFLTYTSLEMAWKLRNALENLSELCIRKGGGGRGSR